MIQVRYSTSPSSVETARAADLRENFLVEDLFEAGQVHAVYTHDDRMLVGGAVPADGTLELPTWTCSAPPPTSSGASSASSTSPRPATSSSTARSSELGHLDGLYVGCGSEVSFTGEDAAFYFVSVPAGTTYPTTVLKNDEIEPVAIGTDAGASARNLYRYVWGQDVQSYGLQFGVTVISDGSVWNTMPPHLHDRRTEVYLYVDLDEDDRVFHFLGQPGATRHVVVSDRQAVISPPWSIHSGAGTGSYAFIWAMTGENNAYTDLASVALEDL